MTQIMLPNLQLIQIVLPMLQMVQRRFGWQGPGGRFDILPLVLQADGNDPELFPIPEDLVLQVQFTHPE